MFTGVAWELERAVCLPAEKERYEEEVRPCGEIPAPRRRPRLCGESASAETQTEKTGKAGYRGRKEKIERLRDGLAAVLAEHSTDGRSKTAPVGKAGKSGPCDPLKER